MSPTRYRPALTAPARVRASSTARSSSAPPRVRELFMTQSQCHDKFIAIDSPDEGGGREYLTQILHCSLQEFGSDLVAQRSSGIGDALEPDHGDHEGGSSGRLPDALGQAHAIGQSGVIVEGSLALRRVREEIHGDGGQKVDKADGHSNDGALCETPSGCETQDETDNREQLLAEHRSEGEEERRRDPCWYG